ncbi:MAG: trans-acting enoyl reductase family protein [Candidatus Kapaibacterium sp.]
MSGKRYDMRQLRWMLYGAYGFTGKLITSEASRRGYRPILAGRDRERLLALSNEHMLSAKSFSLSDQQSIEKALEEVDLVVQAAGPYAEIGEAMVNACLRTGTNYVDISGELGHFQRVYLRDAEAREKQITLIPGCGFDVIPTDSMAAYLKQKMPEAIHLELAIDSLAQLSAGTAKAAMGVIAGGGYVREDGLITKRSLGEVGPNIRFHRGERRTITVPFADLESAWHTTGIPSISNYLALPPGTGWIGSLAGVAQKLLSLKPLRRLVNAGIDLALREKSPQVEGEVSVWGRVTDRTGRQVECWMKVPEPYHYTAIAVLNAIERLSTGIPHGVLSPTQAFGIDFALSVPETIRQDRFPI